MFQKYIKLNKRKNTILKITAKISAFILVVNLIVTCSEKETQPAVKPPKPVKSFTISNPEEIITRKYPGKVEANQDAILSFQVPGMVKEFPISKGQEVTEGDIIAKIDPVDYQLKLKEAVAVRDERGVNLERTKTLLKKGYAAQAEFDKITAQYEVADANVNLAKQDLKYTEILAPFTGRIADTYIENHEYIKAKDPIALLHNTENIDISIDVPENIMIRLKETETVSKKAIFDTVPDKQYDIEFKDAVMQADPKTQTYKVFMTLKNPEDINVLPGMTATLEFKFRLRGDTSDSISYLVPVTSVYTDENKNNYVWNIKPDSQTITAVKVTTGELKSDKIQILEGLKQGDKIVYTGVHLLREGQQVAPYENDSNKTN